jgi:glycosyltransferase involved in cell wall biosynthesis
MKRVAIFLPGAIGHTSSMHVPAIVGLVSRLSAFFDITVYSFVKPDGDDQPFTCGNAKVKYIRANFDDAMPRKVFQFIHSFREDHRGEPFDLLHGFWALPCGWIAVVLGKLFRLPSIVSVQGSEAASLPEIDYGDMRKPSTRSVTLWTCENARLLSTLTRFQLGELQRFGLKRNDAVVIPYGAEEAFFVERESELSTDLISFIHVGFSNAVKDQVTLLKAFKHISEHVNARLKIVGGGPLDTEMKNFTIQQGISAKVNFLGYRNHSELPDLFRQSDVLLHTSLYEAEGVVIAEAAASQLLIAGTNVGLIADLGKDASISVKPGDDQLLAEKVLQIIKNPKEIRRLRSNAHSWACEHTADRTSEMYKNQYQLLLDNY